MGMDTLTEAIAATLRAERAAADLTQDQVAEAIGKSPQTVMRFEQGKRMPSTVDLVQLAAAFRMPTSELVRRVEERMKRP